MTVSGTAVRATSTRRARLSSLQQPLRRRGRARSSDAADREGGVPADPQHPALDLGDVVGVGRDPARGGGLQGEGDDADDEQQVHHGGDAAVLDAGRAARAARIVKP